ncbi:MAG: hypothetical protein Greene041639_282 [Parcubacteria group bacterium Greene0416_39]|nr:MAG: hypothetical protein Greene041639_282 [Parcubacteria group bacterium Greene0416_39]
MDIDIPALQFFLHPEKHPFIIICYCNLTRRFYVRVKLNTSFPVYYPCDISFLYCLHLWHRPFSQMRIPSPTLDTIINPMITTKA